MSPSEIIQQRLTNAKITEAAIIDETFDGISSEVLGSGLDDFVSALEEGELLAEVQKICAEIKEATDFDLDSARALWAGRDAWSPALKPHAQLLYNTYAQRSQTLSQLAANLEQVGLRVHTLGVETPIPHQVGLVFLDYCLEPEKDLQLAGIRQEQLATSGRTDQSAGSEMLAERIARRLADLGVDRPFLVLISDRKELTSVQNDFRLRTNYLGGTFACLAKMKAADQEALYFHLGCWGIGHPALGPIRQFFEAVVGSVDKTSNEFKQALLALDAQDYSFIQRLSLSADGEPLGEYMLDLIGAALSHRLRAQAGVLAAREVLDRQHFVSHLPSATQPSSALRKLYHDALTDPGVGDLAPHPLHHLESPQPAAPLPKVTLGDIFASNHTLPVLMVVNAACALQFSPANPGRCGDPELSIFLIRGKLESLSESISNTAVKRTELFEFDGTAYRILWDPKHVISVLWGEFGAWCAEKQYRRVGRLAVAHALSVQQTWTADVGRVGVMTTPPLTEPADFQIYLADQTGLMQPHGPRVAGQVILGNCRKEDKLVDCFVLTGEGMSLLRDALAQASAQSRMFADQVPAGPHQGVKAGALRKRAESAGLLRNDWNYWFELVEQEQELRREAGARAVKGPGVFLWQAYPRGKKMETLGNKVLIVVDILRPESPDAPLPQAGAEASGGQSDQGQKESFVPEAGPLKSVAPPATAEATAAQANPSAAPPAAPLARELEGPKVEPKLDAGSGP